MRRRLSGWAITSGGPKILASAEGAETLWRSHYLWLINSRGGLSALFREIYSLWAAGTALMDRQ